MESGRKVGGEWVESALQILDATDSIYHMIKVICSVEMVCTHHRCH